MTRQLVSKIQMTVFFLFMGAVVYAQNYRFLMPAPDLQIRAISVSRIMIQWDNLGVEKNISDFKLHLYRRSAEVGEELIAKLRINRPYFLDQDLIPGVTYDYKAAFTYQEEPVSPFSTWYSVRTPKPGYSFFVAGHTYGIPGVDNNGFHPPFQEQLNHINNIPGIQMGFLTGDIVIGSSGRNWDEIDRDLAQLNIPVYFSYGNHDYTEPWRVFNRYGPTYHSFRLKDDFFLVLNSEIGPHDIKEDQLAFLEDQINNLAPDIKKVFVFTHKLIWIDNQTKYTALKTKINSTAGYNFNSNFWSTVEPLFRKLKQQVYFFAGDIGVTWSIPAFYDHYSNIHFVASGMGGHKEENYLVVYVTQEKVYIEMVILGEGEFTFPTIEDYNLDNLDLFSTSSRIILPEEEVRNRVIKEDR